MLAFNRCLKVSNHPKHGWHSGQGSSRWTAWVVEQLFREGWLKCERASFVKTSVTRLKRDRFVGKKKLVNAWSSARGLTFQLKSIRRMLLILEGFQSNNSSIIFILNCISWWFMHTQTAVKRNNLHPASAARPAKIPWTISESLWLVSSRGALLVANTSSSCPPRVQPMTKFSAIMIFNYVFCFFRATGKRCLYS